MTTYAAFTSAASLTRTVTGTLARVQGEAELELGVTISFGLNERSDDRFYIS